MLPGAGDPSALFIPLHPNRDHLAGGHTASVVYRPSAMAHEGRVTLEVLTTDRAIADVFSGFQHNFLAIVFQIAKSEVLIVTVKG